MREYTSTMENQTHGIVDRGPYWRDSTGKQHPFVDEDGRRYIGLLNGSGGPLKIGEPLHILWFNQGPDQKAETNG